MIIELLIKNINKEIIMTVSLTQNLAQTAYQSLPSIRLDTPKNILAKANRVALPAIALVGASFLPRADGGPVVEVGCMAVCAGLAFTGWGALWYPTCMQLCFLSGFTPTP